MASNDTPKPLKVLKPAPPKQLVDSKNGTSFLDLPAELRIEIYKLALREVTIHILPLNAVDRHSPHALVKTSKQVRSEALPLMHMVCPIQVNITDFNFDGLLAWISRIPPDQEGNLAKNEDLNIHLNTTMDKTKDHSSLRKWLHLRADTYRPQPDWQYTGPEPDSKTANAMRRKAKRSLKPNEQKELVRMLVSIGVRVPIDQGTPPPRAGLDYQSTLS